MKTVRDFIENIRMTEALEPIIASCYENDEQLGQKIVSFLEGVPDSSPLHLVYLRTLYDIYKGVPVSESAYKKRPLRSLYQEFKLTLPDWRTGAQWGRRLIYSGKENIRFGIILKQKSPDALREAFGLLRRNYGIACPPENLSTISRSIDRSHVTTRAKIQFSLAYIAGVQASALFDVLAEGPEEIDYNLLKPFFEGE
ncbi:MAG: hypothetical protein Q8R18_05070 [bacterium]|nr:hypothetical protein [bacterium]